MSHIHKIPFNFDNCDHNAICVSLCNYFPGVAGVGYHANGWSSGCGEQEEKHYEGFVNVWLSRFYMDDETAKKCAEKSLKKGDSILLFLEPSQTMTKLYSQTPYELHDED